MPHLGLGANGGALSGTCSFRPSATPFAPSPRWGMPVASLLGDDKVRLEIWAQDSGARAPGGQDQPSSNRLTCLVAMVRCRLLRDGGVLMDVESTRRHDCKSVAAIAGEAYARIVPGMERPEVRIAVLASPGRWEVTLLHRAQDSAAVRPFAALVRTDPELDAVAAEIRVTTAIDA